MEECGSKYTPDEIKNHDKIGDCWIIIEKKVYDITTFLGDHPGGYNVLLDVAGDDATESFFNFDHSENAKKLLESYFIGFVIIFN